MLVTVIVVGEIAFWAVLLTALLARYVLRWRRVSTCLLWSVPLVDLAVLMVGGWDLHRGNVATSAHGLAAAYLGFSVAFGTRMVRWADQRVAYRFAGGPAPWRPPKQGRARVVWEWQDWGRALYAVAIAAALLVAAIAWIGDAGRTGPLTQWLSRLAAVAGIWFVVGPLWTTIFGKPLL